MFHLFCLIRRSLIALLIFGLLSQTQAHTLKDIKFQGLKRIAPETVIDYLPFEPGENISSYDSGVIIRSLFNTGFFDDIEVYEHGRFIIIKLKERATIGYFKVEGNREIPKDKLDKLLKDIGLAVGRVFNDALLEKVQQGLKEQYISRGRYNVRVTTSVKPMKRNRVSVKVDISEGLVTRIKNIRIVGNKSYPQRELLKQFELTTPGLITFFSQSDQYSADKLQQSLQGLTQFYLDRGYIKFKIESSQVSLTPNKKHVYITIKIYEGPKYYLSGFKFAGKLVVPEKELNKLAVIKKGDVFSREKIQETIHAVSNKLGDKGYSFSQIDTQPEIDEKKKEVFLYFYINPGRPVYVRRIDFTGNHKTADQVLRRAMRQYEGGLISTQKIEESTRQLRLLTYIEEVRVKQIPVPGTNNQVDLVFIVTETTSAEASVSAGYGTNGPEFNAGINQYNFLGTGNTVGLNFKYDSWQELYSYNYYNPYTDFGFGRGFNMYYQKQKTGRSLTGTAANVSTYTMDKFGAAINYNVPINDFTAVQFGFGYEHAQLTTGKGASAQLVSFKKVYGSVYRQIKVTGGWNLSTYDRLPFPTKGFKQSVDALLSVPGGTNGLNYYKLNYQAQVYVPLFQGFILSILGGGGYGNGFGGTKELPFYENYYAGGIGPTGQLRGFGSYDIGPKDTNGQALGAQAVVMGSVRLILPFPQDFSSVRLSVFVDTANVYDITTPAARKGLIGDDTLRFSSGVALDWRSPLGPLTFSLAWPLNKKKGDPTEVFQFTVSSGF